MIKIFNNIVISAFDDGFMDYAIPMYMSVKRFHPELPLFAGSLGLSDKNQKIIQSLGVTVLENKGFVPDHLCLSDLILQSFLEGVCFRSVMWIDADTLMLRPFSHLFDMPYEFIGHGGNIEEGRFEFNHPRSFIERKEIKGTLVETDKWGLHYAMGLWVARNPQILVDFYELARKHKNNWYEGDICSELINKKYHHHQLDGYLWSLGSYHKFGLDEKGVFHKWKEKTHYPYQVGFSRKSDGSREENEVISRFYETKIQSPHGGQKNIS